MSTSRTIGYILQVIGYLCFFGLIFLILLFLTLSPSPSTNVIVLFFVLMIVSPFSVLVGKELRPEEKIINVKLVEGKKEKVIICPTCDTENEATTKFCKNCGTKLRKE
jgi:uncharacterized paraquat-inducible protein A